MKNIKHYIPTLVYILLFFFSSVSLKSQNLKFKHLSIEDGLSAISVNTILQDRQGFIWIGTQDGLNRYDGYHIKIYKTGQNTKSSISSNFINCLYEDKHNNLYIGTNDGGMSVFNKQTETFTNYKSNYYNKSISSNSVRFITELSDNELLIATEIGLNIFNTTTKVFERINNPDSIPSLNLKHIYRDSKNAIYIASEGNGLFEYEQKSKKLIHYPFLKNESKKTKSIESFGKNNMHCLIEVSGNIWCGTDDGIFVFDKEKKVFSKTIDFASDSKLNNKVNSFSFAKDPDNLWIGTWAGIIKYNTKNGNYNISVNNPSNQNSLSDNKVSHLFSDKQYNLWVSTWDKGVNIYFTSSNKFPLWDTFDGLTNDFIYSILETKDKTLWVGTADGLFKKTIKDKKFTDVSNITKKYGANTILSLLEDKEGKLWIGTFGQGIIIHDPQKKSSGLILNKNNLEGTIVKLIQSKTGVIWAGTFEGLYAINPNTKSNRHYTKENGLSSQQIITVFEDQKNSTIWVGTFGGGLCILDFITDANKPIIKIYKHEENKNSISCDNINHIYKDKHDIYWISTNDGLNKFDLKKKTFYSYTEKDGLLNSYIYASIPDQEGNLWLPSNYGLTKFNPNINNENGVAFKNYNTKDGIQAREFNQGAFYSNEGGNIYVGGIDGLNYFNPKDIQENKITPNTFIYSFSRQGKEIKTDTNISYIKSINLKHKENFFTFEVVAIDYQSSGKNKFIYKLEGYDSDWSSPSDLRFISYTDLPGGDYTFKVKANNSDGIWNEKSFELAITVIPPWWRTKWFYVLITLLLIASITGFTSYRTSKIKKENKLLEIKVADRTKELEEKNRDITSSIEYAKRIQEAILPSQNVIFSKLKNTFIIYKPKDIVSGDFYWFGEKNNYKIIAAVDCTGHGVPGAFMSMIGHNILNQIVLEQGIHDPGDILTQLHKGVQNALKQGQNQVNTSDGMDVSIAAINTKTNECLWAGAFRNLIIISKNGEFKKIEGNKQPIGGSQLDENRTFKTNPLTLEKNDMIYLFSDGYADQFGGEKGKKLMVRSFQEHLINIHHLDAKEQKVLIEERFVNWKGNYEQVDDVLVIGIKI